MVKKSGMAKRGRPKKRMVQNDMMMGDGKIWDTIKKGAQAVNKFLKDTKVLSTVASMVPKETPIIGKVASTGAPILKSLGYGNMEGGRIGVSLVSTPSGSIKQTYGYPLGLNQVSGNGRKKRRTRKL